MCVFPVYMGCLFLIDGLFLENDAKKMKITQGKKEKFVKYKLKFGGKNGHGPFWYPERRFGTFGNDMREYVMFS